MLGQVDSMHLQRMVFTTQKGLVGSNSFINEGIHVLVGKQKENKSSALYDAENGLW
jgi:hypothetical protein